MCLGALFAAGCSATQVITDKDNQDDAVSQPNENTKDESPEYSEWSFDLDVATKLVGNEKHAEDSAVVFSGTFLVLEDGSIEGAGIGTITGDFSCDSGEDEPNGDAIILKGELVAQEFDFAISGFVLGTDSDPALVDLTSGETIEGEGDVIPLIGIGSGTEIAHIYIPQAKNPPQVEIEFGKSKCFKGLAPAAIIAQMIPVGIVGFVEEDGQDDRGFYWNIPLDPNSSGILLKARMDQNIARLIVDQK
jgi:hypothetical protein